MKIKRSILPILILSPTLSHAASLYTVTLLPPAPGSSVNSASAISTFGVAGSTQSGNWNDGSSLAQPVVWRDGQITVLPIPVGYQGGTTGINAAGDVVGAVRSNSS